MIKIPKTRKTNYEEAEKGEDAQKCNRDWPPDCPQMFQLCHPDNCDHNQKSSGHDCPKISPTK